MEEEQLNHDVEETTVTLANRDAEIACLKAKLLKAKIEGLGGDELSALDVHNEVPITINSVFNDMLLKTHMRLMLD